LDNRNLMTTFAEPINQAMENLPDVIYETDHLSLQEKREMLILAHQLCHDWSLGEVDDSGILHLSIRTPFEDCLKGFGEDDFFVFVLRSQHNEIEMGYSHRDESGELSIYVDKAALNIFTDTFNLAPMDL